MTATATTVLPQNAKPARTWGAGGEAYDRISRQIQSAIEHAVIRVDARPGDRVLDVATGTGWGARLLAAQGADVTGVDFAEDVIRGAAAQGPETIDYRVADAEALPFADSSYDAAISTFGVMFCGDPESAAAELARVTRPGGRLVLANWLPHGNVFDMFSIIRSHHPSPPASPSPFAWGDTERLVELLGEDFDLGFEHATTYYCDRDGAAAWEAFSVGYGPIATLYGALDPKAGDALRRDFTALYESYRTGAGILVPREYVVAVGTRRP